MKKKPIPQNKFEVIASRIIQCGVREEVRRQEIEKKKVQYFRCWGMGHYKWEYPNIEIEKEKKRSEEVVYTVSLQKVQQEEKLAYSLQRKTQKYSGMWSIPPRSIALEQREWTTKWEVVMFVECEGYNYKDTKTQENQGQEFVSKEYLRNVQCSSCLKA